MRRIALMFCLINLLLSLGCVSQPKTSVRHYSNFDVCDSSVSIRGRVFYRPDSTPMKFAEITRLSDKRVFWTDEGGWFDIMAAVGDSLKFNYVGTINRIMPVASVDTVWCVALEPYLLGPDEFVFKVESRYPEMEIRLKNYVANQDARIGVAVIVGGRDTIMVNGRKDFPMMSVFKFPLALVVAEWADSIGMSFADSLSVDEEELFEDTYSPMLKKYGRRPISMALGELLEWSLVESDNNACDILLKRVGGIEGANRIMRQLGLPDEITIGASEADMHIDLGLCYLNRATPLAMAELLDAYDTRLRHRSESFALISPMLEMCRTGLDRLVAPLAKYDAVVGHKTGTGDLNSQGRIMAVNDCGYVHLSDGRRYVVAVFVADSSYDMDASSRIIADISEIIFKQLTIYENN